MDVLNRDCFDGGGDPQKALKWRETALGFSVDATTGLGDYNGGIVRPQREHLRLGNRYYRFVSTMTPHQYKLGGVWWIEHETLVNILQRFRATGDNPRTPVSAKSGPGATVLREWLALTFEWNLIEQVVVADLAARIDAYTGAGRVAQGKHVMDSRAYGYAPHLSNLFTIKQLCIPELWLHRDRAFPNARILPLAQVPQLAP